MGNKLEWEVPNLEQDLEQDNFDKDRRFEVKAVKRCVMNIDKQVSSRHH